MTRTTQKIDFSLEFLQGYGAEFYSLRDAGTHDFWTVSAELVYRHTSRLEFSLDGSVGNREYSSPRTLSDTLVTAVTGEDRDDDRYTINFLTTYQLLRNILLEFEFRHREVDSNFDTETYTSNRFIGRLTASF